MTETDIDPDEIIDQHKNETEGGHSQTEAAVEKDEIEDTPSLEDAVADAYERIDGGDVSSNLTLRDPDLAALFHGLEDAGRLADVGYDAAALLDREPENAATRAAALRLLVRIGLQEINEDIIEAGKDGRNQYRTSDEF